MDGSPNRPGPVDRPLTGSSPGRDTVHRMKILMAAVGGSGHTFPLIPLAQELRDAGHAVTFATSAAMADTVASAGLDVLVAGSGAGEALALARERRRTLEDPAAPGFELRVAGDTFGDVMPRALAADLAAWIDRERPDLVIAETACLGASLAATVAGVPCVLHSFGRFEVDSPLIQDIFRAFATVLADFGLPPLGHGELLGHACVDVCPPSLQAPPTGASTAYVPMRTTAWNPPMPPGPARPDPVRPWVYLTLGTVVGNIAAIRAAVEGLTRLDVDVLVAAGAIPTDQLADLPGSVRVEAFVPQAELLKDFSLVVHHGGSGTTLGAAQHGVPQLLLPHGADQFTNAAAVTALGAGLSLQGEEITADAVEQAAATLLADGPHRAAVARLAEEIAEMPTAKTVASEVETWARPPR